MRYLLHAIHHTHWDPIWYFTAEEAGVQFAYNMKELLTRFRDGRVTTFFLDGQTAAIEEYVRWHPEDEPSIRERVEQGALIIGPFHSQLDCFISSGESVINNLRLGIRGAERLGGSSKIAYLPDSFGHSQDFPKIFNQFGIRDFVITRGVGDEYGLKNEFFMQSNDGSEILVATMLAGYGYGTYGFRDGTLLTDEAEDYNKINVHQLIERLVRRSTLEDECVFPIGFDQNPAILDIDDKIKHYNETSDRYRFKQTTWTAFLDRVRQKGKGLKTYRGELYSTQFHRIHRSIFSARADIKRIQDEVERTLTYEVQPLMSMLDGLGVSYDHALIDRAWETLIRCQTHASATLTDETNAAMLQESKSALSQANAMKVYLMKIVAISEPIRGNVMPLVVYHTHPKDEHVVRRLTLYTRHPDFRLTLDGSEIHYTLIRQTKHQGGVIRKPAVHHDQKTYVESRIVVDLPHSGGIGYQTIHVHDGEKPVSHDVVNNDHTIENDRYVIRVDHQGIHVEDKQGKHTHERVLYLEDGGDVGDNYDYSYPDHDWIRIHDFSDARVESARQTHADARMVIRGTWEIPADPAERERHVTSSKVTYRLSFTLNHVSPVIDIRGSVHNDAVNHRMRLVFRGGQPNMFSYAGTQYGFIERPTEPDHMDDWREQGFFEEPSPHYPLLNAVALKQDGYVSAVFTRSVKAYECIGEGNRDLALTLFRSVGHLGLPDLNRRPGRPSGLANHLFTTPDSQMKGEQPFAIGLAFYDEYDENRLMNDYVSYATDVLYYQNQTYHDTVFNMAYFPTNPLEREVPGSYEFLRQTGGRDVFGTLIKADDHDGFVLRVYNASDVSVPLGTIQTRLADASMSVVDCLGNRQGGKDDAEGKLRPGELRNILIRPAQPRTVDSREGE